MKISAVQTYNWRVNAVVSQSKPVAYLPSAFALAVFTFAHLALGRLVCNSPAVHGAIDFLMARTALKTNVSKDLTAGCGLDKPRFGQF